MSALHVFSSLPEDRFLCPICLNVFCDPVMTPCGHNFCKTCLVRTMDDGDEFCRCPKCNKRFHRMSEFSTNTVMAEISTQIKKRRVEAAENPDSPRQVKCDVCKDFKMKASKSCLRCVTSYCNAHLEPHQRVPSLTRHKLIDPVENLEEKHRRILELYCREEQVCVRLLCSEADHKDHKIVSVEEEAARQEETTESRTGEANRMIHSSEISKKIKACNKVFSTLVNKVQDKQIALALYMKKRLGKSKDKNDPLVKELQVEIAELQKKHSALEKLALCALSRVSNAKDSLKSRVYSDLYVQTAYRAMSHLMQTFQEQLRTLTGMELTRLRKYKETVTFDPSTAGVHLAVTNFDTRLKHYKVARSSPSSDSKRFQLSLVLGKKGFTSGRHYWEVQVGRRGNWDVGVVKESVSWTLNFITEKNGFLTIGKREGEYRAYREFYEVINISPRPRKIGVYVDYGEGRVSFYETEQKRHIYSYKRVTFTEKLFPCFFLFSKARKSESITILSIKD